MKMSNQVYVQIAENIDKGIQTAPKSDGELSKAFIAFLKIVYTPEEAELVQYLSMHKSKTVEELIEASGMDTEKVNEIIDTLSKRAAVEGRYKKRLPSIPTLLIYTQSGILTSLPWETIIEVFTGATTLILVVLPVSLGAFRKRKDAQEDTDY